MSEQNSHDGGGIMFDNQKKKYSAPVIILSILLVCSGMLNLLFIVAIVVLVSSAGDVSDVFEESLVDGDSAAETSILMLTVSGVIQRDSDPRSRRDTVSYVKKRLKLASEESRGIAGVLLVVNSPGGGVTESDEIYREIREFQKKTGKPVIAFFQNVAASGGYYISSSCDEIIAQPTSITGSIGVIMSLLEIKGFMKKTGIGINTIISDRTPFKDIGSPFREMQDNERAKLREMVDAMHDRFVSTVTEGRRELSRDEVLNAATGMIYTADEAVGLKLVDRTGYIEDAIDSVRSKAGAPEAKVIEFRRRPGFIESILTAKTRDISVNVMPVREYIKAHQGMPMYLWFPGTFE